jgi:hypothetical protein
MTALQKKKKEREQRAGQIERILLKGFTAHHGKMRLGTFWHIALWDSIGSLMPEPVPLQRTYSSNTH